MIVVSVISFRFGRFGGFIRFGRFGGFVSLFWVSTCLLAMEERKVKIIAIFKFRWFRSGGSGGFVPVFLILQHAVFTRLTPVSCFQAVMDTSCFHAPCIGVMFSGA